MDEIAKFSGPTILWGRGSIAKAAALHAVFMQVEILSAPPFYNKARSKCEDHSNGDVVGPVRNKRFIADGLVTDRGS